MISLGSLSPQMWNPPALIPMTLKPLSALAGRAQTWSVQSQQVSRRNAMVANTALTARRHDREDVESWFAELDGSRDAADGSDRRAARR